MSSPAVAFATQNHSRFVSELKDLLRIPSISTLPEHKGDCCRAAEFLSDELKRIGIENVRLIETSGHPLVYADWLHAAGKPTALVYGHYDVQPTDPIDEWISPPFEPTERNGNIYARGAVDDKGQVWTQVKALESLMAANKGLPLNVRVLFEGEEEVGGEGIAAYVASKPGDLKADFALVSDTEFFAPDGLPTLCVGLRGMIYTELEVRGAKTDLHSGMYGGAAPNPFVCACAHYRETEGREWAHPHSRLLRRCQFRRATKNSRHGRACRSMRSTIARTRLARRSSLGESGYSVLERTWARPTLDVHGMPGGFTGAGAKTVIPAKALAKVSMRLVPNMTPAKAFAQYKSYVEKIAPEGVDVRCPPDPLGRCMSDPGQQ